MGRAESVRGMKAAGFDPAQCEVVKIYESQYSRNAGAKGGVECLVQGLLMDMIGRVFSDTYRAGTGHLPIISPARCMRSPSMTSCVSTR